MASADGNKQEVTIREVMDGWRLNDLSLKELEKAYEMFWYRWTRRVAAEVAYALAMKLKAAANELGPSCAVDPSCAAEKEECEVRAEGYARKCVEMLSGMPAATLEDVAVMYPALCGTPLPDRFYDDYARRLLTSAGLLR